MGLTLAEKIISAHAGKNANAGELVIANVDVSAVQDGTGPLTVQEFKKIGKDKLDQDSISIYQVRDDIDGHPIPSFINKKWDGLCLFFSRALKRRAGTDPAA